MNLFTVNGFAARIDDIVLRPNGTVSVIAADFRTVSLELSVPSDQFSYRFAGPATAGEVPDVIINNLSEFRIARLDGIDLTSDANTIDFPALGFLTTGFGQAVMISFFDFATNVNYFFQLGGSGVVQPTNLASFTQFASSIIGGGPVTQGAFAPNQPIALSAFANTTVSELSDDELVIGTNAQDFLTGGVGQDTLQGLNGNDVLNGGTGDDRLEGGAGFDVAVFDTVLRSEVEITLTEEGLRLSSADGLDELINIEQVEFLDQSVLVSDLIEEIVGRPGVFLVAAEGGDTLIGTDDNDTLIGEQGQDGLAGGPGNDTLEGNGGNDSISGSDGNDLISGGAGNDNIGGGQGVDTIDGGSGDDIIGGGFGADSITGGAGNDVVAGGADSDTLQGGDGNDSMSGSFGNDSIDGGEGADDIGGGTGRDTIDAGAGDDRVGGGEGDDSISGGDGNDFLAGGGRNDVIDGGAGNDTINAGAGNDVITGGADADLFVFSAFFDGESDAITDFEDGSDIFLIRRFDPDTGLENINNGGNGLAGFLAAMNIVDWAGGAQMTVGGNTILVEGVTAAQLTVDDFQFL
ncbi:calcium-binding protein [Roseovarius mucosus]|uniref:calcium-binding protein n=1 Tax=Roseovarius mucosus TaxID=215743 RepID=UPI001C5D0E89|nr:calcium-binding protein [Roseovarius mucosus]MBW4975057.1 calcium-binding protein [Roseovarius mucosus]